MTVDAHSLPIENVLVGTHILEESPDEGYSDKNLSKNPTVNINSNVVVVFGIKERWPTFVDGVI